MILLSSEKHIGTSKPVIALVGPTAIGKTELSLQLAEEFNAEIIGVDSMQIYKYMDIGTAKPTIAERNRVPHHLVDFVDPAEDYNAARFVADAGAAVAAIRQKKRIPLMAGGTGLYFKAFFEGIFDLPRICGEIRKQLLQEWQQEGSDKLYQELLACDPQSAERIHKNDQARVLRALEIFRGTGTTWSALLARQQRQTDGSAAAVCLPLKIGLTRDRDDLYDRINHRVDLMVQQGLLKEVEKILAMGYSGSLHSMQSLGYRHMVNYVEGVWSWQQALQLLARDTRRYAKRQLTWFRKDTEIYWFTPGDRKQICSVIKNYINNAKTIR